ncbi:MAG: hypothetical protein VX426_05940 [Chloroflexota bacterium]|jgi:hypothetical protein|nr:hypothetical protein [Chloroflexota bacterium]
MNRFLSYGLGTLLFILVITSVVLAINRKSHTMKEGTPERVVQIYLQHLYEEDFENAYALLNEELQSECTFSEFLTNSTLYKTRFKGDSLTHKNTNEFEKAAIVTIELTSIQTSIPFGADETRREELFTLSLEEGLWKISDLRFPTVC